MRYLLETRSILTVESGAWAIRDTGDETRRDHVPCTSRRSFALSAIRAETGVNDSPFQRPDGKESRCIFAKLTPHDARYSMLGTQRTVTDFKLGISEVLDGEAERCGVAGMVSYTKPGERGQDILTDDYLIFSLRLSAERFDRLFFDHSALDGATFMVGDVAGFYADHMATSSPDRVKVLTRPIREHPVEIPEGCTIAPPRLGNIADFELRLPA